MTPKNHDVVDGFLCRPGTSDRIAVEDTRRIFRKPGAPELGDVVLDLGAHIGSFAGRALNAGAVHVTAVEPEPSNVELLRLNVVDPRLRSVHAAIAPKTGTTTLYTGRTHGHTIVPRKGRPQVTVPTYTLEDLINGLDLEPTFIKIDIEGGEYGIGLPWNIPRTTDRVFMEFHLTFGQEPQARELRAEFDKAGWSPVWETPWRGGYVEGVYSR